MDALEFYIGELEKALDAFAKADPLYNRATQNLVNAARGVVDAWDEENTPPQADAE